MMRSATLLTVLLAALACLPAARAASTTGAMQAGEHQAVVNDVRLWYKVAGRAGAGTPPLLFLHGGPGYNSYSFEAQAGKALESKLQLVYLDQRGSGRSERPWTGAYSIPAMVEDIEALRKQLGVPKLALMGHSFGGALALEYAAAYPQHVSKLVLVSAASSIPDACAARVAFLDKRYPADLARARAAAAERKETPDDCFFAFNSVADDIRERVNDETMFPDMKKVAEQRAVDAKSGLRNTGELGGALWNSGFLSYRFSRFERLTMPVLVLAGQEDHAIGLPAQRLLAKQLPKATLVEYAGAGHFPYLDAPQRFNEDVVRFVRGR
ncbi:alpha/beta fold hydrolase [Massilia sp. Bi118]|uniref:alpha/beta fold hydrolase n=1 Tax=Massilia sp. Bi118 TaxID=2822346 RepID=UPI001E635C54|nr:alpha/beta hydrolase [Massilia sp. Bi118]